jgi:hypothetical protein
MNTGGSVSMLLHIAVPRQLLHLMHPYTHKHEQFKNNCARMKFQVKNLIKQVHSRRWKSKFFQMKFQFILDIAVPGKHCPFIIPSDFFIGFPYRKVFTQLTNYADISIC